MRKWLTIFCLSVLLMPVRAQQMEVVDFARQKKGILWGVFNSNKPVTDKQMAVMDMMTGEKGFEFKANGTTAVQAEEGDGKLTLKVPHKTTFLLIKHPDYGQLTWKVPDKRLKKKKHYQATLLTYSPDKEYKLQKQWVVFKIEPANAILTIDSVTKNIRNGDAQLNLPLGKHTYRVESPFYEAIEDSLVLTDSVKLTIPITLQSIYSYLTVRTPLEGCDILLDGEVIGQTVATSGHLQPGKHRITVLRGHFCYYDNEVMVGRTEKKVIDLKDGDLTPQVVSDKQVSRLTVPANTDTTAVVQPSNLTAIAPYFYAPVTIEAAGDSTEILVDMDSVGIGKWEGKLAEGFHTISTRQNGMESHVQYIWIDDEQPKTIKLLTPMADYGMLNIHCNVVGADIFLNGMKVGTTPCVLEKLSAAKPYRIRLSKKGYRDAEKKKVKVIVNDMVDVTMKLKEIKKKKNRQ